ncbi:MAG: hypothetical protein HY763_12340 [Planctomycetes bacterium]|nr:hypothetical protein [Planctomycetota bacterium]
MFLPLLLTCVVALARPTSESHAPTPPAPATASQPAVRPAAGEPAPRAENLQNLLAAIPDQALLSVIIPDPAALDGEVGPLLGGVNPAWQLAPWTWFKTWSEIVAGLEEHAPAALVVLPADPARAAAPSMALLLPTGDPTALVMFLNPRPAEAGLQSVTIRGRDSYVSTRGRLALIASNPAAMRILLEPRGGAGEPPSAALVGSLERAHAGVRLNPRALRRTPGATGLDVWLPCLFGLPPLPRSDIHMATWTARVEDGALRLRLLHQVDPASHARQAPDTDEPLLVGLPDEPVSAAAGLRNDASGAPARTALEVLFAALSASGGLDPARTEELLKRLEALCRQVAAASLSLTWPTDGDHGPIGFSLVLQTRGDAGALRYDIESIVSLLQRGIAAEGRGNRAWALLEMRRGVERAGENSLDHVGIDLARLDGVNQAAARAAFGDEGLVVRVGTADRTHLVLTLGGGLPRFQEVAELAAAGRAPLAAQAPLARAAREVAERRSLEAFVFVDRLAAQVHSLSEVTGASPAPRGAPPTAPPIVLATHTIDAANLQLEVSVPVESAAALYRLFVAPAPLSE